MIDWQAVSGVVSILLFSWCIGVMVYEAKRRGDHILQEFIYNKHIYCPHCGTTEMLCGFNGVGCTHESEESNDYQGAKEASQSIPLRDELS